MVMVMFSSLSKRHSHAHSTVLHCRSLQLGHITIPISSPSLWSSVIVSQSCFQQFTSIIILHTCGMHVLLSLVCIRKLVCQRKTVLHTQVIAPCLVQGLGQSSRLRSHLQLLSTGGEPIRLQEWYTVCIVSRVLVVVIQAWYRKLQWVHNS